MTTANPIPIPTGLCPLPISDHPTIQLAHGGGGRLMQRLIDDLFLTTFQGTARAPAHDATAFMIDGARLAFTTDAYVVRPLFFPGGNIGDLAINGTVNDLAMCGARPLHLSAAFILEEGFSTEALARIAKTMRLAADVAGVGIITGDTKVVDKGHGDGLYITTAGVGRIEATQPVGPAAIRPGDAILLSGDLGRHGIAVMAQREGLTFDTRIESDCAPLWPIVADLLAAGLTPHCMRDLTRGGLASALVELAEASRLHLHLRARAVPLRDDVRGACEMLGLDPLYVANEGRMIVILPQDQAETALTLMRRHAPAAGAVRIGEVDSARPGHVTMESEIGTTRMLDMLSGEQLPRIC